MTREEHIKRHKELHAALDELVADWIRHGRSDERLRLPSNTTIDDLLRWSYMQTNSPEELTDAT